MPGTVGCPEQIVRTELQSLTDLLDELDVRLDFRALVAGVPIFVDVQGLSEAARGSEAPGNTEFA